MVLGSGLVQDCGLDKWFYRVDDGCLDGYIGIQPNGLLSITRYICMCMYVEATCIVTLRTILR